MRKSTDVATDVNKALDALAILHMSLSARVQSGSHASFSSEQIGELIRIIEEATASLKKILAVAAAAGGGPTVRPRRRRA